MNGEGVEEVIYVLYGSQTGNSEQAAKDFCDQVSTRLPQAIRELNTTSSNCIVVPQAKHMQLDDFLEFERAKWTRLIVIFVSSYGVGQAPLGSYRFREMCDAWVQQFEQTTKELSVNLEGVHYALCGLGDSKYTTFFRNPTVIDKGLSMAGAKRVGPLGKADASGTGDNLQSTVVEKWIDEIWPHLAKVLVSQDPSSSSVTAKEHFSEMQRQTLEFCREINPNFFAPDESSNKKAVSAYMVAAILMAILSAVIASYWTTQG